MTWNLHSSWCRFFITVLFFLWNINSPLLISWFMVYYQTLNYVLVTASELADMRALLKQTSENDASKDLFVSLHSSWCHSPSATISLCLFAQVWHILAATYAFSWNSFPLSGFCLIIFAGISSCLLCNPVIVRRWHSYGPFDWAGRFGLSAAVSMLWSH